MPEDDEGQTPMDYLKEIATEETTGKGTPKTIIEEFEREQGEQSQQERDRDGHTLQ